MRALSLTQPWATLVASGLKTIETRSWRTNYRGPLAIHAAKGFPPDARGVLQYEAFKCVRWVNFPLGQVLAVVDLIDCIPMPSVDDYRQWIAREFDLDPLAADREHSFGHFDFGRFAWKLANVRKLDAPVTARGARQLWEWTA